MVPGVLNMLILKDDPQQAESNGLTDKSRQAVSLDLDCIAFVVDALDVT